MSLWNLVVLSFLRMPWAGISSQKFSSQFNINLTIPRIKTCVYTYKQHLVSCMFNIICWFCIHYIHMYLYMYMYTHTHRNLSCCTKRYSYTCVCVSLTHVLVCVFNSDKVIRRKIKKKIVKTYFQRTNWKHVFEHYIINLTLIC